MADNVIIHNKLTVRVRNVVEDIVTGGDNGIIAATDGKIFSASIVNQRLLEAYAWIVNELVAKLGVPAASLVLSDSIVQQLNFSIASAGTSVNKDYLFPVRLLQSATVFGLKIKSQLDADLDPYLDNGYAIDGGKIYVYQRVAGTLTLLNTGTATLHYLKADRIDPTTGAEVAVNTTPDITLNSRWHEACIFYAAYRLCADKGVAEWADKAKVFHEQALSYLK